jgi:hypothetical protein
VDNLNPPAYVFYRLPRRRAHVSGRARQQPARLSASPQRLRAFGCCLAGRCALHSRDDETQHHAATWPTRCLGCPPAGRSSETVSASAISAALMASSYKSLPSAADPSAPPTSPLPNSPLAAPIMNVAQLLAVALLSACSMVAATPVRCGEVRLLSPQTLRRC